LQNDSRGICGLGEELKLNKPWEELVYKIVHQYNSTAHAATRMSPNEAEEDKHALDVKLNLLMQAKRACRYPRLRRGGPSQDLPEEN